MHLVLDQYYQKLSFFMLKVNALTQVFLHIHFRLHSSDVKINTIKKIQGLNKATNLQYLFSSRLPLYMDIAHISVQANQEPES